MADKVVSPGVFANEIDASFLPATIGDIGAVVVGPTVKGPVLQPTVISSYAEYVSKFGNSFKSGSSYYQYLTSHAVENYLRNASTCTIVRIAGAGYSHATAEVSSSIDGNWIGPGTVASGSATQASCSITMTGEGTGSVGWIAVSKEIIGKTTGNTTRTYVRFMGTGSTQAELATDGAHPNGSSSVENVLPFEGAPTVTTYFYTTGSHALASTDPAEELAEFIEASQSLHGVPMSATASTPTVLMLTADYFGPVYEPLDGPTNKWGGSDLSGSYDVRLKAPSAFTDSDIFGSDSGSFVGGSDFNNVKDGDSSSGSIANGTVGGQYRVPFKIHTLADGAILNNYAGGQGTNGILPDGNMSNIRWEINQVDKELGTFNLLIRSGQDTTKRKNVLETWNNLNLDPDSRNYIARVIGDQYNTINQSDSSDPFIQPFGEYPNKSKYVRIEVLRQTPEYHDENGDVSNGDFSASLPGINTGSNISSGSEYGAFVGGSDGTVLDSTEAKAFYHNITSTNNQGLNMGDTGTKTNYEVALNLLANADEYDFNLILLPGLIDSYSDHTSLITKAIDVCETRGDAFLLADPVPYNTTNISTVVTQGKKRDSSYAAMYWPWVQIKDRQIGVSRWVPPSVIMAGIYSNNDKVGHPWFAPAGLNRGLITTAVQAERKLTHGNRDVLYASNVNPLATFTTPAIPQGQGVVVWGQKTLQKKASALDRVNVRRLMIKVKKFIAASSRFLVFEQNTVQTRNRFLNIANPFLEQVQAQSGVSAFRVIMDDTNNPSDLVDRNILYGQIFVQPTRTAEFIILDFTVQPTGATFPGE